MDGTEEIELAVVGAHLRGLPLSPQLLKSGGRFVRQARTRPTYRLYVLESAAPIRPGMIRVPPEIGCSIEVEVWSLPVEGFGRFVARVAPPLCIGTLELNDGTSPKGFLCEACAVADAPDISSFGGWRSYLAAQDTTLAAGSTEAI